MVNGDLTRYPEVGCPWGARTGEPRAKAGARYCELGWGPTIKRRLFIVRAHPLAHSDGGCHPSLTGYPPSSQGFLSPPWARTWDHELRYPFEVVPTTN